MSRPPSPFLAGWRCACPQCGEGRLFAGFLTVAPRCTACGLDLTAEDSGDGPAVFLVFLLGFSVAPAGMIVSFSYDWPIWLHALVWGTVTLGATVGAIRPLKAYTIALQYKHRRQASGKL